MWNGKCEGLENVKKGQKKKNLDKPIITSWFNTHLYYIM